MFRMTARQVDNFTSPFKIITPIVLFLLTVFTGLMGFFATRYLDQILLRIDKIGITMENYIDKNTDKISTIEHRVTVLESRK